MRHPIFKCVSLPHGPPHPTFSPLLLLFSWQLCQLTKCLTNRKQKASRRLRLKFLVDLYKEEEWIRWIASLVLDSICSLQMKPCWHLLIADFFPFIQTIPIEKRDGKFQKSDLCPEIDKDPELRRKHKNLVATIALSTFTGNFQNSPSKL